MRLFLDASISPALAGELKKHGFDVVAQRERLAVNSTDDQVLLAAWTDNRIMVARDYDMAELVLRKFAQAHGVVIVAFDSAAPADEAQRIASELNRLAGAVEGSVVVIENNRTRRRPLELS